MGLNITAGAKAIGALSGAGKTHVSAGASLTADSIWQNTLSVAGQVNIRPNGTVAGTSVVSTLDIAGTTDNWTGRLDIADNDVVIHSSAANRQADVDRITNQLKLGLNATTNSNQALFWSGNGIITSNGWKGGSNYTGIGVTYNDKAAAGLPSAPLYTSFDGETVGLNDVLVKYTYFGDADLDGQVTSNDYFQIDTGFLASKTGWINGDFDYSGEINSNDYFLIDSAFLSQTGTLVPAGASVSDLTAVPEPGAIGVIGLAAVWGSRCRKRRRRRD
jgi:hypothetical protein